MSAYDLVVIGAGPAGSKAATQAAYYGKRVIVVDRRDAPGGTAVSEAGIPTKTLRETAQYLTGFRHRDVYGIGLSLDAGLKLERMRRRTAEVVTTMKEAARANLARMKVELLQGEARLAPDRSVVVSDRTLRGAAVIVASGSRPHHPKWIPFDDPAISDSETILKLDHLPKSMVVIGGGAIGCEYASIFTALGVHVTLVEAESTLLSFMDRETSGMLAEIFTTLGTRLVLSTKLANVAREGAQLRVELENGEVLHTEHLFFAGGRVGNTEGLGLEEAGIALDDKGRVIVDAHYMTNVPGVYAVGDVIGPPALASVSMEQGRVAACHAFGIDFKHVVDPRPPFGVYSIPEAAMVGLTEEKAKADGIDYEVGRGRFASNTRARIAGTTEGMIKLVFRRKDRVLLGVHIVGDVASELIHLGQLVIGDARAIDYFIHATFNVPTFSEAYKYAAYDGLQRLSQLPSPPRS